MKKDRNKFILSKMLKYCNQVEGTHKIFNDDEVLFFDEENGYAYRNAVTMPVFQIGELVKNLSEDFCKQNNLISWKQIARFRDVLAHHYGSIEYNEVWKTSHEDIKELKNYLLSIKTEN